MDTVPNLNGFINNATNKQITVKALREKTRKTISTLLNPLKIFTAENNLLRDWRGLAELCNLTSDHITNIKSNQDPSNAVLILWSDTDKENSTINNLITFLEKLDRFDVIDDIEEFINDDIKNYQENITNLKENNSSKIDYGVDNLIITRDDVLRISQGLGPQNYDAFVLFADDDIDFATELIETMEKQFNLKFCVKDRDLVGGVFEYDVITKLITERCNRLLVILSPAFFKSPANKFFVTFTQAFGIEQNRRKIIPCIYKPCAPLPSNLSCYFSLVYKRSGKLWNFWSRLNDSITTPNFETTDMYMNLDIARFQESMSAPKVQISETETVPMNDNNQSINNSVVKFSSMINLNTQIETNEIIETEQHLNPSTSANELYRENEEKKDKIPFFKRLLPKKNKDKLPEVDKEKKRFWNKHKRKAKVAS